MSNPIYSLLGGQTNNMQNMINQFQQFRNTFSGDPKQQVQNMLSSGKMSQSQFEQYAQMATQLRQMLK